jgi:hypothetical protein
MKYYNPTDMYKAAINIRSAFVYAIICPQFKEKTYTATTTGHHTCDNTVPGTLICNKGYITGISSGYGKYADSIGIKCSSGENYGYGNNNGGFGGDANGPKTGGWYDNYKEIPSPEGFRKYASNYGGILDNLNFYGPNLEHKGMIGSHYGDAYGDGTCQEGQLLVGFNLQKGCSYNVLKSIQGICRKQPPISEGIVCDV